MEKPTQYSLTWEVTDEMTAKRIGSAGSKILSTPNMVALMEAAALELAKAYLDEKGVSYLEKTGTTSDEIIAAVNSMLGQVDAVFTPTDNAVQATELAIAPILAEAGIPHYAGADSFVRNGAFATCGVNYTDLGTQTADLALEVLQTGEFPEYVTVSGDIITVNTDTAATLGLDYSLFQDMGSQVVEVQTTQD